jgi:putative ABC transport system permease protein
MKSGSDWDFLNRGNGVISWPHLRRLPALFGNRSLTPISWHNTFHNPRRCFAAGAGIAFAVLLLFMEVGFLDAARLNAALLYESLEFDAVIVSRGYVAAQRTLPVDSFRLSQAGRVSGVIATAPLLVEGASWFNALERRTRSCRVVGVEPRNAPFVDAEISGQLDRVARPDTVLMDRLSSRKYGPWQVGGQVRINDAAPLIAGTFALGTGLISDGGVIASQETFRRIIGRGIDQGFDIGLLRFAAAAEPEEVIAAVRAALPGDVMVLSRADLIAREQYFWVSLKPVGIMFHVGALVAFLIGSVVLYQVLALEVGSRISEFATMKAMGFSQHRIYRIGVEQGLIFALLGYVPAFLLALVLYRVVFSLSRLPLFMEAGRAGLILLLTLFMCAIASVLALKKLRRADPAELF